MSLFLYQEPQFLHLSDWYLRLLIIVEMKVWKHIAERHCCVLSDNNDSTVMILSFRTVIPGHIQEEQSDQGLHCLSFRLHCLDSLLYGRAT